MRKDTQLKQQALMLKAAFEEGLRAGLDVDNTDDIAYLWEESTAKTMHDQLLAQAKGNLNVQTNVGNG